MTKHAFPVRIVEHFNPENFTSRGRRGAGVIVAGGFYRVGEDVELIVTEGSDSRVSSTAKHCENSVKQLFSRLRGGPILSEILEKLAKGELSVEFVEGDAFLLSLNDETGVLSVACDLSLAPDSAEARAFELLLLLGHFQLFLCWLGRTQRQALGNTLDIYATFTQQERDALHEILDGRELDSGNLFALFLGKAALNAEENDGDALWRDQRITWLLGQDRLDLPYQRQAALDILGGDGNADERRFRLYRLLRGYDRNLEQSNIERIAAEVREARQQLIFGRMSRAFHNQAMLFANAVLLQPAASWRELAVELAALTKTAPAIQPSAMSLAQLLNSGREIPLTQLEGACERFEQAVIDAQKQALTDALFASRLRVENHNDTLLEPYQPPSARPEIIAMAEQGLRLVERIRQDILSGVKRYAAYVVISQRPSPTGSHLLAKINEFEDPYAGKAENLRKLIRLAGDRVYSSPDYAWLEVADHWIEAIPLFIKEEVLVRDGRESTRTVIDISGMEVSFREEMADFWAKNLSRVLQSELLYLAHRFFSKGKAVNISDETKVGESDVSEIAALGVLFSEIYRRRLTCVQKLIEADALQPLEAMERILLDSAMLREAEERRQRLGGWMEAVRQVLEADGYGKNFELEMSGRQAQVFQPKRALPTLHVLTTQSAGMTEGYIRTWLEESMALFNIVEDLGWHEKVAERESFFNTRILSLGEKVIRELGVWIEVEALCADEQIGASAAILRLINRNRRIQENLSCLGALIEWEETQQGRRAAGDCGEPRAVADYLHAHAEALRKSALLEVAARQRRNPENADGEAVQRPIQEDEYYRQDLQAFTVSIARRRVLEELNVRHPQAHMREASENYLRRFQQLRKTTARKQIIAEHGLQHLTLHPYYYYRASGGGKRYHLIYTP
ncbi:MAG: hypothetical protein ABSB19_19250, partial [Methylomonas sp.]